MKNRSVKDDIRDYWGARAATYDASPCHVLGPRSADWEELLTRHLGPSQGRSALDLGCGTGEMTLLLHGLGFRTTGLDMTPQMMMRAQAKAAGTGIRFIAADAEATMEPPESHDVIVARYLFWTLSDPQAALADWLRVLKPGGTLLLIDGDHVTPPPLGWLAPWFDRLLGYDPKAGHALLKPAQWDAHRAIVAQLPFRDGLRSGTLLPLLEQAGFQQIRAESRGLRAFRPLGWRQRLLALCRHRFVVSARKASVQEEP